MTKPELRKHFASLRKNLPETKAKECAIKAAEIFFEQIPLQSRKILTAYYPVMQEISTEALLKEAHKKHLITGLPVLTGKEESLVFKKWQPGETLTVSNLFQVKEPVKAAQKIIPDIMVVPLLAFDNKGHRLGYGRGYYDRTIQKLKEEGHSFITVGYAYECQYTESLPVAAHDQMLDYVVTEKKLRHYSHTK